MASEVGLRQVGEFPTARRMIRTVRNPLDKATIVSVYPKEFTEVKETIQPRSFTIPAGTYAEPGLATIPTAGWWKDVGIDQPLVEIPISATQMAESIINDYCVGLLACDMNSLMPGLFYVNGEITKLEVVTKYKVKLLDVKIKQENWFRSLIKLADSLWARSNNNPLVIWDEMRIAARELGQDKPWIKDFALVEMIKCFACGSLRNPQYPICPTCKVVDPKHPLAAELKFAQ